MKRICLLFLCISQLFLLNRAGAQTGEAPLNIFGYFQNSFQHWTPFMERGNQNTFNLQQLNFFFQKDLSKHWSAFVNFEFVNNFSSSKRWGSADLEEAWIRYRVNARFNLKLGLQIPIFNNLNEINNRTPLLPYIIRPLVYETSFSEIIPVDEFIPRQAFVQVYGFFPAGKAKWDYAAYLGNSANINSFPERGQTGIDTTAHLLYGARFGLRYGELKAGISGTLEKRRDYSELAQPRGLSTFSSLQFKNLNKIRIGADLSYNFSGLTFESEYIDTFIDEDIPDFKLAMNFFYTTLGYHLKDNLYVYGSYWITNFHFNFFLFDDVFKDEEDIVVPNGGIAFDINERLRLKAHYSRVMTTNRESHASARFSGKTEDDFSVIAIAASVFF